MRRVVLSELSRHNLSESNPLLRGTLDTNSFANLFGTTADIIDATCGEIIDKFDFRYEIISEKERDEIILLVLKTIESGDLKPSGKDRKGDWEKGWQENLNAFIASNYDILQLSPKYITKYDISRVFSKYVKPIDKMFELNFYTVFRHFLFNTYFGPYKNIFEFGCGSGYNLAIMNKLFPDKHLIGLDWAESSVKIADSLGVCLHAFISGKLFNYFQPDYRLNIPSDSLVITLNSLEQLGDDYKAFLDFILNKKPALCINAEPILEMYDDNNLIDYLAIRYHRTRNYLAGYYDALKRLESEGRVKIINAQRIRIGNLYHEGYSFIVWNVIQN
jgi:SAM-dependent methyltransferase